MAKFFVKHGKVHKHGAECKVNYEGEELCDEPPKEVEKCDCLGMQW